jgi:hypothetical protein
VAIVAIARVVAVVVVVVGPPPFRGVGTRIDHLLSAQADVRVMPLYKGVMHDRDR